MEYGEGIRRKASDVRYYGVNHRPGADNPSHNGYVEQRPHGRLNRSLMLGKPSGPVGDPEKPTQWPPGSVEKIELMRLRFELGMELHMEGDVADYSKVGVA